MQNQEIEKLINENKSFVYKAGAGSGKTFTLIESINHVLQIKGSSMRKHGQKIMVITYTNAAVNEIINRIGINECVQVTTIHDRLWSIISNFKDDIKKEFMCLVEDDILKNKKGADLIRKDYPDIIPIAKAKEFQHEFFLKYDLSADDFRSFIRGYKMKEYINNVSSFKDSLGQFIRFFSGNEVLGKLKDKGFSSQKIIYNPLINKDRLSNFEFSHDSLLRIGTQIITNNKTVQRIIVDCYPYIFVDEYQDTSKSIIRTLSLLVNSYSQEIMIGLFGDPLQTIYSNDVVGNQLEDLIPTINLTSAKINYRSVPEIVNLANKIRNDKNQEQIPLKSSNNRAVHAYTISSGPLAKSRIDEFINQYLKEISKNDTVDVLSLKNEDVATWCGFDSFFKEFKGTPFYKEHFKSYADDIMSNDLKKLHPFFLSLYNLANYRNSVLDTKSPFDLIIPKDNLEAMTIIDAQKEVKTIRTEIANANTIGNLIDKIGHAQKESIYFKSLKSLMAIPDDVDFSKEGFGKWIEAAFLNADEDNSDFINRFLGINILEFNNWYLFVSNQQKERIKYHTIHSSKGREYSNLILILSDSFQKKKNYYSEYFSSMKTFSDDQRHFLLYVGVTRAINRLDVIFVSSNYPAAKKGFEEVFENVIDLDLVTTGNTKL